MAIQDDDNEDLEELPMSEDEESSKVASSIPSKIVYTAKELLDLRESPFCNVKPEILNDEFFDANGRWNPNLWHSSLFNSSKRRNLSNSRNKGGHRNYTFGSNARSCYEVNRRGYGIQYGNYRSREMVAVDNYRNSFQEPIEQNICALPQSSSAYELGQPRIDFASTESESATTSSAELRQKRNVTFASADCPVPVNEDYDKQEASSTLESEQNAVSTGQSADESTVSVDNRSEGEPEWLSVSVETTDAEFDFGNLEDLKKEYNEQVASKRGHGTETQNGSMNEPGSQSTNVGQFFSASRSSEDKSQVTSNRMLPLMTLEDIESGYQTDNNSKAGESKDGCDELKAFKSLVDNVNKSSSDGNSAQVKDLSNESALQSQSRVSHMFSQQQNGAAIVQSGRKVPNIWNSDKILAFERHAAMRNLPQSHLDPSVPAWNQNCMENLSLGPESFPMMSVASQRPVSNVFASSSNEENSATWSSMPHVLRRNQERQLSNAMFNDSAALLMAQNLQLNTQQIMRQQSEALLQMQKLQQERMALTLAQQKLLDVKRNAGLMQSAAQLQSAAELQEAIRISERLEYRYLQDQLRLQEHQRLTAPLNDLMNMARNAHSLNPLQTQLNAGLRMRHPIPTGGLNLRAQSMRPPPPPPGLTPALQLMFQRQLMGAMQHVQN